MMARRRRTKQAGAAATEAKERFEQHPNPKP